MAITWGIYGEGGTIAQDNALVASTGATFTTIESYIGQPGQNGWTDWRSTVDWEVPQAVSEIPPSAGGKPMLAISPLMSGDATTTFNDINSGSHDSDFNYIFQEYAAAGYKEMSIRPLWEMNLGPVNPGNQQAYIQAFQHIANLAHNNPYGIKVDVIWNPGSGNTDPIPYYPGDQYVDQIGVDESAGWGNQGNYTDPLDLNPDDYTIGGAAAFAAQHNKPLTVCEGGVANGGYTQWLGNVLTALNETGAKLASYSFYDATDTGADERWQTDQSDINAVTNFIQNAPAWTGGSQGGGGTGGGSGGPPSPSGTKITQPTDKAITDQNGNSWTLVQSASNGLQIAINGTVDAVTHSVVLLETLNGAMVQENTSGNWYLEKQPNDSWVQIANPTPTPSPNGTTITSASAPAVIDASGNAWTLVQSTSNGLQIAVNGTVDAVTSNVVLLESLNGAMVQENTAGNWYSETQPNAWVQISAPVVNVTTGSGSDTLVLSISEDPWANGDSSSDAQGDAAFTVAVDGHQLAGTFFAHAMHAAGASQSFTFNGNWAPGAHNVSVNFLNDAYGGSASTDRNLYVNDITYDGADTKQSAALMGSGAHSFSVTDATALPPPRTGAGQDLLLLEVSEDYYLGNAQFTVAVDGKQLGGTFTATTLHSSGSYQTFALAGDFAAGTHAVTVNFLNDAYGGSASTDRNLYVNDIIYNGHDTHQSKKLSSTGPKSFSVTGGTTPSVSETSDHGALQKNLAQTGTYAVGGDSFVLSTGNAVAVTLGTGASKISFIGASAVTLTGGSGQATVTADTGNNKFVAGSGSLDVTGGAGKDAYVFHATSGLLTVEDFSLAKNDTLTIDKSLQSSLHQASDGMGGTMLTFGTAGQGIDLHAVASLSSSNIVWA